MQESNEQSFQKLNIFENTKINIICDNITKKVKSITQDELMICGSLSKIFAGILSENYYPKDIDFIVSQWNFRKLIHQMDKVDGIVMIEKLPHKIILYTECFICIEIWFITSFNKTMKKYYYKNLIPYLYGSKI